MTDEKKAEPGVLKVLCQLIFILIMRFVCGKVASLSLALISLSVVAESLVCQVLFQGQKSHQKILRMTIRGQICFCSTLRKN
ncbi:Uncharacterised protein [Escherichia coli]|uniref:Uncharacterized protein n=1 Tax=Escherichia coli TaxID=562 RepID=A0A376WCM4_ECOLX|nr:Uncharacterised protein [Escherichia coli]